MISEILVANGIRMITQAAYPDGVTPDDHAGKPASGRVLYLVLSGALAPEGIPAWCGCSRAAGGA